AQNIATLRMSEIGNPALAKYAALGELLSGRRYDKQEQAWDALVATLQDWTARLQLPLLSSYGVAPADFDAIIAGCRGSSMKTNPIVLSDDEVRAILQERC
ncbi:MAG TPA: iron-containing alcohol dehydrogenase, partial [Gammaproteobacteria bacterium]|nr:iron-containing alcohol dehydrogenase [Gammaproteobacteria bacterium]